MSLAAGSLRSLAIVLALLGALAAAPAQAAQFECGGFAPLETSCETEFVLPAPIRFNVAGGDGWPLEGRVEFLLEGPTGRRSFSCILVTTPDTSVPLCGQASSEGHFDVGQTLTLRGNMAGTGNWHVYVLT